MFHVKHFANIIIDALKYNLSRYVIHVVFHVKHLHKNQLKYLSHNTGFIVSRETI